MLCWRHEDFFYHFFQCSLLHFSPLICPLLPCLYSRFNILSSLSNIFCLLVFILYTPCHLLFLFLLSYFLSSFLCLFNHSNLLIYQFYFFFFPLLLIFHLYPWLFATFFLSLSIEKITFRQLTLLLRGIYFPLLLWEWKNREVVLEP